MKKIGIADTMFARVNMARYAIKAIEDSGEDIKVERYTVPGVKDLPVACKKLIDEHGCDIVLALGMPGPETIDKTCAHEASTGIIKAQLLTNKHILEVFIHGDEADDDRKLLDIVVERTRKHTLNALSLLKGKEALSPFAGTGRRQGHPDIGPIKE